MDQMGKDASVVGTGGEPSRWLALATVCLGELTIVIDTTVVNVALPSIREDLNFADSSLVWVVNAYMLTFGGSLLLGGRLGDLYGRSRLFLIGIALFTLASAACSVAQTPGILIAARAVQGLGAAVSAAVSLSLIVSLFADGPQRVKAIAIYTGVCAVGAGAGLLLGGALTSALDWHWIFVVNLPIGVVVCSLGLLCLPDLRAQIMSSHIDILGAIAITGALILEIFAVDSGTRLGWASGHALAPLGIGVALFVAFLVIETHVRAPLIPLRIFQLRSLAVSSIICVLWSAGSYAWFLLSALYMQIVLGYGPMQLGLAFVPANAITALLAFGVSTRLIALLGTGRSLSIGLVLSAIGMALFGRTPVAGSFVADILPGMLLYGISQGIGLNPLMVAALKDVVPEESGLGSGILNTSSLLGGALGLAIVMAAASARADAVLASGAMSQIGALAAGYHAGFLLAAGLVAVAALLSLWFSRKNVDWVASRLANSASIAETNLR